MTRKIFFSFIRDKSVIITGFFADTFLLILFYTLSANGQAEILYPVVLSLLIFLILINIEWFRYYRFTLNLQRCAENVSYELQPVTSEQKEAAEAIEHIHRKYLRQITEIYSSNKDQRHFISQWIHNMKTPVSVMDLIIRRGLENKGEFDADGDGSADTGGEAGLDAGLGSGIDTGAMEMLSNLNEENTKLNNILEQVLNILRLEDFTSDYVPESVDLVASVRSIINGRKNQFIYNNVFPRLECTEDTVPILTDRKWNELIIDQLVSNAIKYSGIDERSKNIRFIIKKQKEMTTLTIRDEGIGIPSYDMSKVFEPFFTGENGRKNRNATGIGLYICSVAARKLGHTLSIESEAGKGTSVTISYLSKL
ncbi:MAG TPA: sensor histidine kinase [Clostridia bacterium]|nr:sensor histidine kinase [Clostridia bacterium]